MTAWVQFAEGTGLLFLSAHLYAKMLNATSAWLDRRRH